MDSEYNKDEINLDLNDRSYDQFAAKWNAKRFYHGTRPGIIIPPDEDDNTTTTTT